MNANEVAAHFRSGRYGETEKRAVIEALRNDDVVFLEKVVFQYIKHVKDVDAGALLQYLGMSRNAYICAQIVSGLSYHECAPAAYSQHVLFFAAGLDWDEQGIVRLAALLALPRVVPCNEIVKKVLRAAQQSSNPVIRDAAMTSAQVYLGREARDVRWGEGENSMSGENVLAVNDWLQRD